MLRSIDQRLIEFDIRLVLVDHILLVFRLLARDRALSQKLLVALKICLILGEESLIALELRGVLVERSLVRGRVDLEENFAGLDRLVQLDRQVDDAAGHRGNHMDRVSQRHRGSRRATHPIGMNSPASSAISTMAGTASRTN